MGSEERKELRMFSRVLVGVIGRLESLLVEMRKVVDGVDVGMKIWCLYKDIEFKIFIKVLSGENI